MAGVLPCTLVIHHLHLINYDARLHALIQLGMTLCQGNWKNCRFACRDVDISRLHHCIESALATEGSEWIIAFVRATGVICQDTPPFVLAPAALAFLAAIADDRV